MTFNVYFNLFNAWGVAIEYILFDIR